MFSANRRKSASDSLLASWNTLLLPAAGCCEVCAAAAAAVRRCAKPLAGLTPSEVCIDGDAGKAVSGAVGAICHGKGPWRFECCCAGGGLRVRATGVGVGRGGCFAGGCKDSSGAVEGTGISDISACCCSHLPLGGCCCSAIGLRRTGCMVPLFMEGGRLRGTERVRSPRGCTAWFGDKRRE